jgi:hypothetical protein
VIRTTRTFLALVLGGGLALAACGGDARGASDNATGATSATKPAADDDAASGVVIHDRLVSAAKSTANAGSARVALTMSLTMPGTKASADVTATGVADFKTGNMQMTMDMGPLFAQLAPHAASSGNDFNIELRMVDRVMYMRYPSGLGQDMAAPTPWISIDLRSALDALGGAGNSFGQFEQTDPTQYLQYLAAASPSGVHEVGHEQVRGVDTTHYRASIDLTKALDQLPSDVRDMLGVDADQLGQALSKMRGELGADVLPMDVWIDGDGLLRKFRMNMSVAGGGVETRMEMYDYGVDVSVQAPPADQVTDLGATLGNLGGYSGSEPTQPSA